MLVELQSGKLKVYAKIRWDNTGREHRQMIEAIKNKDIQQGYKIMHDHISRIDYDVEVLKQKYPEFFTTTCIQV